MASAIALLVIGSAFVAGSALGGLFDQARGQRDASPRPTRVALRRASAGYRRRLRLLGIVIVALGIALLISELL